MKVKFRKSIWMKETVNFIFTIKIFHSLCKIQSSQPIKHWQNRIVSSSIEHYADIFLLWWNQCQSFSWNLVVHYWVILNQMPDVDFRKIGNQILIYQEFFRPRFISLTTPNFTKNQQSNSNWTDICLTIIYWSYIYSNPNNVSSAIKLDRDRRWQRLSIVLWNEHCSCSPNWGMSLSFAHVDINSGMNCWISVGWWSDMSAVACHNFSSQIFSLIVVIICIVISMLNLNWHLIVFPTK